MHSRWLRREAAPGQLHSKGIDMCAILLSSLILFCWQGVAALSILVLSASFFSLEFAL